MRGATILVIALLAVGAGAQKVTEDKSKQLPVVNGEAGPCSVDIRVTDLSGTPLYAAKIQVQVRYGFGGMRKLDLEVGTNAQGKARFAGLPKKTKAPLQFQVTHDGKKDTVISDPATNCHASHTAVVR